MKRTVLVPKILVLVPLVALFAACATQSPSAVTNAADAKKVEKAERIANRMDSRGVNR